MTTSDEIGHGTKNRRTHKFFFLKAKNQFLLAKWIKQVSCQVFHPYERGELLERRQGDVLESLF